MNHRPLFVIVSLLIATPVFGQQSIHNEIGPVAVPVDGQSADEKRANDLLSAQKYTAAQQQFEKVLQINKSAQNYAGLAESLAMQNKIHEAQMVLKEARAHEFANDVNVAAVGGHVCYLQACAASDTKFDLYIMASVVLCKRALAVDPHNRIALGTLAKVRSKRFEKAKEFEENGDLLLAKFEYEMLLEDKNDDVDAKSALSKLKLGPVEDSLRSEATTSKRKSFVGTFKEIPASEIPASAKVQIAFDTPLNSDTSKPGDKFSARTIEPISEIDGYVILPEGAVIKGTVTKSGEWRSDQHISKDGKLQLRFDSIEATGIAPMVLVARLVSHGGIIHGTRNIEDIAFDTSSMPDSRPLFTWFLAKKGKVIDVRVGDQFKLEFPDGLRVLRQ